MSNKSWRPGSPSLWTPGGDSVNDAIRQYLKQNPGRPSQRNIVIKRFDGFAYEKRNGTNDNDTAAMHEFTQICARTIITSYMSRFHLLQLDNDKLYDVLDQRTGFRGDEFINRCKRFIRENVNGANLRIEMPQNIEEVFIKPERGNPDGFQVWHLEYNKKKTVVKVWVYFVDLARGSITNPVRGPMVLGKRSKDVDMVLRSTKNCSNDNDYTSLILISEIIRLFRSKPEALQSTVIAEHQDVEMFFIRKLVKEVNNYESKTTNIFGWENLTTTSHRLMADALSTAVSDRILRPDETCPLVDLSEKEIKFMTRYIKEKNYLGKDGVGIDAVRYFSHPRYGPNLRIQMADDNDNIDEIITSLELFPEDNFMRFYGVKVINPDLTAYVIIDFTDLAHFNIYDNLCDVASDVFQRDPDKMIASGSEIESIIPECFRSVDGVLSLFFEAIVVHIMLFDRPKRTRMIRYTERPERPPAEKHYEEPEFLVRRILKPVQEAKQLVLDSKATGGQMGERFYTMEEWDRVGHWRRLPHSEHYVWIEETTCHRHLPLSDKEIHIKM